MTSSSTLRVLWGNMKPDETCQEMKVQEMSEHVPEGGVPRCRWDGRIPNHSSILRMEQNPAPLRT